MGSSMVMMCFFWLTLMWSNSEARVVDFPLPVGPVDRRWRERARSLAPSLVDYQQYTDIEAAIRAASEEPGGKRHLILLTDGVIDLAIELGQRDQREHA